MLATRMRMAAAGATGTPAAGWWVVAGKTCVAAYQPIGAASLAASYTNLANPGTHDAAPGTAPTWASGTGWTFDTTQYLLTNIVGQAGWSLFLRFSGMNLTLNNRYLLASYNPASGVVWGLGYTTGTNRHRWFNGGGSYLSSTVSAAGVQSFAAQSAYFDGDYRGEISTSGGALPLVGIEINGFYFLGAQYNPTEMSVQAVAIYSDTLSGAEVATLSAAMAALT